MSTVEKLQPVQAQAQKPEVSSPTREAGEKHRPGGTWRDNEEHVLPNNRLGIVFSGLMACIFLAALDQVRLSQSFFSKVNSHLSTQQTIVATALPTIVQELGGGKEYSWVGRFVIPLTT